MADPIGEYFDGKEQVRQDDLYLQAKEVAASAWYLLPLDRVHRWETDDENNQQESRTGVQAANTLISATPEATRRIIG